MSEFDKNKNNTPKERVKSLKPYLIIFIIFVIFALMWNTVLSKLGIEKKTVVDSSQVYADSSAITKSYKKHKTGDKTDKIAVISTKLKLTVEEAQKFWPIYNEYHHNLDSLKNIEHKIIEKYHEFGDRISKGEMLKMTNKYADIEQVKSKLFITYNDKFQKAIPIEKVFEYYLIETNETNEIGK